MSKQQEDLDWLARNVHEWPDMHKSESEIDTSAERVQKSAKSVHVEPVVFDTAKNQERFDRGNFQNRHKLNANDWYERGELPPVGLKCEMFSVDDWEPVFIVGYSADGYMVVEMECEFITATPANKFRPLRTERDVLLSIIQSGHFTDGDMADAILAAGFTKGGMV